MCACCKFKFSNKGHYIHLFEFLIQCWFRATLWFTIQYNTIQLYCLSAEKFAFWLVIYIKTFNTINNKTSTTQWNTELKTAQIQGKYLTITMYTHTHARTHAAPTPTHTHTLFLWLTNNLKHSINYNKTKFLKQQNTKIETLNWPQHINYRQHLCNILNPGSI